MQIALATEDDILILDPESEFGHLTRALGGEVIQISATSDSHINALDMDRSYGDERNPIVAKSEFVLSLYEQLVGGGQVSAKEKSILGRCTELVYQPYIRNGYQGTPPTLRDFYRLLKMQPEPEAQGLALASELFITARSTPLPSTPTSIPRPASSTTTSGNWASSSCRWGCW